MNQEEISQFYTDLAAKIPSIWYAEEELEQASNPVLDHLKKTINMPMADAALKSGKTETEFLDALVETSRIFGKLSLFKKKFPEIISKFPRNLEGKGIYPTNILAKVLNVSEDDAIEIAKLYFGESAEVSL